MIFTPLKNNNCAYYMNWWKLTQPHPLRKALKRKQIFSVHNISYPTFPIAYPAIWKKCAGEPAKTFSGLNCRLSRCRFVVSAMLSKINITCSYEIGRSSDGARTHGPPLPTLKIRTNSARGRIDLDKFDWETWVPIACRSVRWNGNESYADGILADSLYVCAVHERVFHLVLITFMVPRGLTRNRIEMQYKMHWY